MSNEKSTMLTGYLCLTDINKAAKEGHSAFVKGKKNGKIYLNIVIWLNPERDEYDNDASIMLQSVKDKRELEGKQYVGNARIYDNSPIPLTAGSTAIPDDDDLPF